MKRSLLNELQSWKNSPKRKPLIIKGARQTGKTWLIKEFGRTAFQSMAYINFERNRNIADLFKSTYDLGSIIQALSLQTGVQIDPQKTLIVFDEIQEAPEALTALKYFYEEAPQYHIVAAGSLLGMALLQSVSFPVGKVDFLKLSPMDFHEFLLAVGDGELLELLESGNWELLKVFRHRFIERLRSYYMVGGMPEAVAGFAASGDYHEVRKIQKNILDSYELDFSKHANPNESPRIRMVWNSIPGQLAKEKRKFVYSHIKQGARAKDFEMALAWLTDCGQVLKVNRVSKPGLPIKAYEDLTAFKLFLVDIGLLAAMTDLSPKALLDRTAVFSEFKGALTEQFACQQIHALPRYPVGYWSSDRGTAEVDFLIQAETSVTPIEVKAEENLKSKSLKSYHQKFAPPLAIRTSLSEFRQDEWLLNIPLYALLAYLQKGI